MLVIYCHILFPGNDPADGSDFPYLLTDHDIDMASRSADSTEDSLGDTNLSPETTEKHAYNKKKKAVVDESGDYLSSNSSDFTESDELSSDDEEEPDSKATRGFVPIQPPEVRVEDVDLRKNPVKAEARRLCKSESDKSSLSLDERVQGFSREGSVSKFKADGSWIKPVEEDIDENGDKKDTSDVQSSEAVFKEADQSNVASVDKDEGIWMTPSDDKDKNTETEKQDVGKVTELFETEKVERGAEDKEDDQYSKENIPWNPGTVLKQKQDIERFGSFTGSLGSVCKNGDAGEGTDTEIKKPKPEHTQEPKTIPEQQATVRDESGKQSESCDISDQSGKAKVDSRSGSPSDTDGLTQAMKESRKSVYEEEEIDLPEGIVRKTMMEIEERNR